MLPLGSHPKARGIAKAAMLLLGQNRKGQKYLTYASIWGAQNTIGNEISSKLHPRSPDLDLAM